MMKLFLMVFAHDKIYKEEIEDDDEEESKSLIC